MVVAQQLFATVSGDVTAKVGCENCEYVKVAKKFRELLEKKDNESARGLMAPRPRRWWGGRDGGGLPWEIDEVQEWEAWDRHFRSKKEVVRWEAGEQRVIALIRETNDYYALLERPPVLNEATYFFDDQGRIEGLLIRAVGERPRGRTDEFMAWAKENAPDELAVLMPEGEIDPSGENPRRFRELLDRWRRDSGLAPVGREP